MHQVCKKCEDIVMVKKPADAAKYCPSCGGRKFILIAETRREKAAEPFKGLERVLSKKVKT